jgi:hypothetical protein
MTTITLDQFTRVQSDDALRTSFNNANSHAIYESTSFDTYSTALESCSEFCKETVARWLTDNPAPETGPIQPWENALMEAAPEPVVIVEEPTREVLLEREVARLSAEVARLNSRTYSRYDESMRPMFFNAARIANEADFCSEYDRIASAVGAPTRDEFFAREFTFTVDVEVTRTVSVTVSATGSDEDDAWEYIDRDSIRDALENEDVEYDDFGYNSYDSAEEGELVEIS